MAVTRRPRRKARPKKRTIKRRAVTKPVDEAPKEKPKPKSCELGDGTRAMRGTHVVVDTYEVRGRYVMTMDGYHGKVLEVFWDDKGAGLKVRVSGGRRERLVRAFRARKYESSGEVPEQFRRVAEVED